ncbi:MAG TPA: tRNA lysidine(34) synthetase TilS [Spirochaetes bacterium]|nr:tRNA lysidine(34) synthetase TilS [Spirochaetota bacterium]
MSDIFERVKHYCMQNDLIRRGDKVLLAVSGGPDSIALLHVLHGMRKAMSFEIAVAHLEHGLRGESSVGDQLFVKKTAQNLMVDFYTKNISVADERARDESLEEAARRVRYRFLLDVLKKTGFHKVATGHTIDDNIETIIYRMATGTGPAGFTGIFPQNTFVIHPVLGCTKDEILFFLDKNEHRFRVDVTNSDTKILRNKIRHDIVPMLSDININYKTHILNLSGIIREEDEILDKITENCLKTLVIEESKNRVLIDYERFFSLKKALKRRIVLKLVRKLNSCDIDQFSGKNYFSFKSTDHVACSQIKGNKILYQNKDLVIRKEYGGLLFQKRVVNEVKKKYLYHIKSDSERIVISEIKREILFSRKESTSQFEDNRLYFDLDKVEFPVLIRSRRNGDRIRLKNLGVKKLKTIFINEKVPPGMRDEVPIVEINGEITGIFSTYYGRQNRVAEGYMITECTRKILICDLSRISQRSNDKKAD